MVYLDSTFCPHSDHNITIWYAPLNNQTSNVVSILEQNCHWVKFKPKKDAEELQGSLIRNTDIGLVFNDGLAPFHGSAAAGSIKNAVISYTIRMNISEVPSTLKLLPAQKLGDGDYSQVGPRRKRD